MKQLIIVLAILLCTKLSVAQANAKMPVLYGKTPVQILKTAPYSGWYDSIYKAYEPLAKVVQELKTADVKEIKAEIFYGSWCGDSRREVPRFMKVLQEAGFKENAVSLIAVGGTDSLYKQSPGREEAGKGVFRVPVMILYKSGKEMGRINEFPAVSLEQDLLNICKGNPTRPNYQTFALVNEWLTAGFLTDNNTSLRGLARQLKPLAVNEHELNSLGYVLMQQGKKKEALRIFQINAILYPESANVLSSLGEGYLENDDAKSALITLEQSLLQNKDPELLKEILAVWYKAKELARQVN